MRRVVVTGLGAVTPLGVGLKTTWPALLASWSGIRSLRSREDGSQFESLPSKIAGLVPLGRGKDGGWDPDDWLEKDEQRKMALFTQYAVAAAEEAMGQSGLQEHLRRADRWERARVGTTIGSGIGSLQDAYTTSLTHANDGYKRIPPLFVPRLLINLASFHVASRFGLHGPSTAPTTACTTGAHAIIDAANMIRLGNVDAMVVGASEACIHPLAVAGFARARSLSTGFNDTPEQASRPFDKRRDGFVIGEGAGVLVLEELDFARKRGARILAEVLGYGMSCDADHMTKPLVDGWGAEVAMRQGLMRVGETLARAEGERSDGKEVYVDYINAHATSTVLGDVAELRAIKRAVSAGQDSGIQPQGTEGHTKGITGEPDRNIRRPLGTAAQGHLNISSTKSSIGHLLGAAGSIEAIFTILALREGILPPTLNLVDAGNPAACEAETATKAADGGYEDDPYDGINFVPHKAQKMQPRDKEGRRRVGLSNSFGFGGTNASLVFGEWADQ